MAAVAPAGTSKTPDGPEQYGPKPFEPSLPGGNGGLGPIPKPSGNAGPSAPTPQNSVEQAPQGASSPGLDNDIAGGPASEDVSKWSASQWLDAMERNPEKYMKLFARAKAEGRLTDSAKESSSEIMDIGGQELNSRMEGRALISNLSAMEHQLLSQIIGNIRG